MCIHFNKKNSLQPFNFVKNTVIIESNKPKTMTIYSKEGMDTKL